MTGKIAQTSEGLREALFDAMEKVRDGDMMSDDAKSLAMLAKEICNSVRLEIDIAKLRNQYPSDASTIVPKPVRLGRAPSQKLEGQ